MQVTIRKTARVGPRPENADVWRDALLKLRQEGKLNAEDVEASARPKSSPLHNAFTWDNNHAGYLWRLKEASDLIRCLVVVIGDSKDGPIEIPYFHRINDGSEKKSYASLDEINSRTDFQVEIVKRAMSDMRAYLARYRHYARFFTGTITGLNEDEARLERGAHGKASRNRRNRRAGKPGSRHTVRSPRKGHRNPKDGPRTPAR